MQLAREVPTRDEAALSSYHMEHLSSNWSNQFAAQAGVPQHLFNKIIAKRLKVCLCVKIEHCNVTISINQYVV